jgi:hypothetical protein
VCGLEGGGGGWTKIVRETKNTKTGE